MEEPVEVQCPWCGEVFTTFVDASAGDQSYIEDCQVCCRPIQLSTEVKRNGEIACRADRS